MQIKILSSSLIGIFFLLSASIGWAQSPRPTEAPRAERIFGAGHPFAVEDLPPSRLRSELERASPQARQRALEILHGITFPAADAAFLRIDQEGRVRYEDNFPPPPEDTDSQNQNAEQSVLSIEQITASVAAAKVFKLHSKPGASRVVYLNMAGATVTGTWWNSSGSSLDMLPYDSDGNPDSFTQAELDVIAETWKRVAEDFAPFDIDVTTEKPAAFGPNVGHILVTRKADRFGNLIYNCNCGGVAYVDVWGKSYFPQAQPALVFTDGVGTGAHNISEAASHELGHNLALSHDGTSTVGYYAGHGGGNIQWAPIMGVGYYGEVTQWSKGEYQNATNFQDDLSIMALRLNDRPDDHENSNRANATPLSITNVNGVTSVISTTPINDPDNLSKANKGIIERASDIDLFSIDTADGTIDLTITPVWLDRFQIQGNRGANLDIRATLYDSDGNAIATNDSPTETHARINEPVTAGRYYLAIEGVGTGNPLDSGYSDYASLGQYFINGTVAVPTSTIAFNSPTLTVTEGIASVTLQVTRSENVGGASVSYATANGTAISGSDYSARSGTLTFEPGVNTVSLQIPILDNTLFESSESFTVALSDPINGVLGSTKTATVEIIDNDLATTIQFEAATHTVTEGTSSITIPVRRSNTAGSASVVYATQNNTALAGSDYTAKSGTVSFKSGSATANISIAITNDTLAESSESFGVSLSNPTGGILGSQSSTNVTILDNDTIVSSTIQFSAPTAIVREGTKNISIPITRSSGAGTAAVSYTTADGTAAAGSDFTAKSGTLSFAAGVTTANISIAIINDRFKEPDETFSVSIAAPTGSGVSLGTPTSVIVTITDND